ncbi:response regulator [Oceanidesulfovibrio indonesiensis]|uniref:Response regulator n=1 Tax=Oceanidesulfovibrio indonesiensis TaxID=54767 RepID=A0A7M3MAC2_9BACT|nr:response regulator [Oceanidesulfovibrio indonesiensis]TVM14580.1 response regulator [Oceanidesulfovibrio indonesiensis]
MEETSPKILVVDDEVDFLELFVKRFQKRGHNVAAVESGHEALAYLEENPVDVVVLDVKMPRMNGIEALKEIKKRHPLVEVIMLTGHGSVESGIQGISHGAYDYVMKPFNLEDLVYRIGKANERRQLLLGESIG